MLVSVLVAQWQVAAALKKGYNCSHGFMNAATGSILLIGWYLV